MEPYKATKFIDNNPENKQGQLRKLQVQMYENENGENRIGGVKKIANRHRTAQPPTLATFRSWGSSAGAGRADLPVQI